MQNIKLQIDQLLASRKYDPNKVPPSNSTIIRIGGRKVGSLQNLITVTGKQKNGKSRYIGATIAAAITRQTIFDIEVRTPVNRNRIALFDTEQADEDFYRQMQQIKEFARLTDLPETFDAFNTREDDPRETITMITHYLNANPDCSMIFIDGLLDLLLSFNDERESKTLINHIKRITKAHNLLMIGVIHRGKGNDLTIGHLGSMADRVAQSILKVEKNKERNTYILSAEFLRSDEDFTPIEIYKAGQFWEQTFYTPEPEPGARIRQLKPTPAEIPNSEYLTKLHLLFPEGGAIGYGQLTQNIKECFATGTNWAKDCIKHLRETGIVFKTNDGYTADRQKKINL